MRTESRDVSELLAEAVAREVERRRRPGGWRRAARWVGALCLAGAVAIGGNLAWQIWGTSLTTQAAQEELRTTFERRIVGPVRVATETDDGIVKVPGRAMAILEVPRIDLDMVVVEGTDTDSLKKGPGHYADTAYPWNDSGRVAIAGHRTTYGAPFWDLDKLRPGDPILLKTEYGTFEYEVVRSRIVLPSASWVLQQTKHPTLVLTTCNPRFSAAQRLVVFARQL